jgi:MYXO-CTERM domain-containing protein
VCAGAALKSPEVCNGKDDDCNGLTDDNIPGNGANCTGSGIYTAGPCRANFTCTGTFNPAGPYGLTCTQTVGPTVEICNGIDDDCSGVIDDNLQDNRVGQKGASPCTPLVALPGTTFPSTGPLPPCNPGITACENGQVVCQGEVQPVPNACNGISTDCTGNVGTGTCPTGSQCYQGNCVLPCSGGEFPCPGGFVCQQSSQLCVPDACQKANCPTGFLCNIDSTGHASCIDPCSKIDCGPQYLCHLGTCVDCHTVACPDGEVCVGAPGVCEPSPCTGVICPQGQFCNTAGQCKNVCTGNCPPGDICLDGDCVMDPCANVSCNAGDVCTVQGGVGVCVFNQCAEGCNNGLACCGGTCRNDDCDLIQCPSGTTCQLDSACGPTCVGLPAQPSDQIVGAGGGGAGCSMARGGPPGSGLAWLLLLGLFGLLARRRSEVG